ncbi:hypothetical protein N7478_000914 [Penicillium angulare]|uniref:uncharacterized protein n=1 Tax=Penicillium angulare TaxID=116970 RepID=UPI002541FF3E|nr:uncharacterized protein N7478_000914 [Penicillium angulare]KAJ5291663.1 hypothetical protein N7478_000914 [Penicillium angulare]
MEAKETERAGFLLDAQKKAILLFEEIERSLIRPGVSEKILSKEIHQLGNERFGVRTHWHKRVVRSGPNTLSPFAENPPDRIIEADDILVIDLGPVFEEWEADFGRTFVLGNDPHKKKLRDTLEPVWNAVKLKYRRDLYMTGAQLYDIACNVAEENGFQFGAHMAGHIVGHFPHERIPKDQTTLYITTGNDDSMNYVAADGFKRQWILEVHLRDPVRKFGGFYEQLLTIG